MLGEWLLPGWRAQGFQPHSLEPPRVLRGILTPSPCGTHSQRQEARPGSWWLSDQGPHAVLAVSSSAQTVIENDGNGVNAHWLIFCFLLKWNLYTHTHKNPILNITVVLLLSW